MVTEAETNKKVSSIDFYAYHIMIRHGQGNVILRCRELFFQIVVDMYFHFKTKFNSLMSFIKKLQVFGFTHGWMYDG